MRFNTRWRTQRYYSLLCGANDLKPAREAQLVVIQLQPACFVGTAPCFSDSQIKVAIHHLSDFPLDHIIHYWQPVGGPQRDDKPMQLVSSEPPTFFNAHARISLKPAARSPGVPRCRPQFYAL